MPLPKSPGSNCANLTTVSTDAITADNFSGTDFTTHYVVLGFRFRVAEEDLLLPDEQHDDYRWLTPEALLASDNVHANSRAYFLAEKRAGVPGL